MCAPHAPQPHVIATHDCGILPRQDTTPSGSVTSKRGKGREADMKGTAHVQKQKAVASGQGADAASIKQQQQQQQQQQKPAEPAKPVLAIEPTTPLPQHPASYAFVLAAPAPPVEPSSEAPAQGALPPRGNGNKRQRNRRAPKAAKPEDAVEEEKQGASAAGQEMVQINGASPVVAVPEGAAPAGTSAVAPASDAPREGGRRRRGGHSKKAQQNIRWEDEADAAPEGDGGNVNNTSNNKGNVSGRNSNNNNGKGKVSTAEQKQKRREAIEARKAAHKEAFKATLRRALLAMMVEYAQVNFNEVWETGLHIKLRNRLRDGYAEVDPNLLMIGVIRDAVGGWWLWHDKAPAPAFKADPHPGMRVVPQKRHVRQQRRPVPVAAADQAVDQAAKEALKAERARARQANSDLFKTALRSALYALMTDYAQENYNGAFWLVDLDERLCGRLRKGMAREDEDLAHLALLSNSCRGWWRWSDEEGKPVFCETQASIPAEARARPMTAADSRRKRARINNNRKRKPNANGANGGNGSAVVTRTRSDLSAAKAATAAAATATAPAP